MLQRILVLGASLAILVAAVVISLAILDVVSVHEMVQTLGKTLSVIAVCTIAAVLILILMKIGAKVGKG